MHYETTRKIVRAPVLTWKGFLVLGVLVLATAGVQSCIANEIQNAAIEERNATITARDVRCNVRSVNDNGVMQLSCNRPGNQVTTSSTLAIAYLRQPRPLICTLYRGDEASCKLPS